MGTNYYLASMPADSKHCDPRYHVGKRSNSGGGRMDFMWAMHPNYLWQTEDDIVTELGIMYTPSDFMRFVVAPCSTITTETIGVWFS